MALKSGTCLVTESQTLRTMVRLNSERISVVEASSFLLLQS